MNILKVFAKLVRNNIPSVIIFLVITIIMISGRMMGLTDTNTFERRSYNIVVDNYDDSEIANSLVEFLGERHTIENFDSDELVQESLYMEMVAAHVVIPEGFGESFMNNGELSISTTIDSAVPVGAYVTNDIDSYLGSVKAYMEKGLSFDEASSRAVSIINDDSGITVLTKASTTEDSRPAQAFISIPFGIITLIIGALTPVIVVFSRKEVNARSNVSPVPASKVSLWITLGCVIFAIASSVLGIILGLIYGGVDLFTGTGALLSVNILVFTISIALMLPLIAQFATSSTSQSVLMNVIGLSMCFLGGVFVPLSIMSEGVKRAGAFLPTYWYVTAVNKIVAGATFGDILPNLGIQILFGLAMLGVGLLVKQMNDKKMLG